MTPTNLSNSSPRSSPRIACYGTAFLADAPFDTTALKRGIAPDVAQFSSPRLDASFLINCGRFLTGGLATMKIAPGGYVKRIAGTDIHSPKATIFYECSTELHGLLAALTAERAAEIAQEWYGARGLPKTKPREPNGRTQRRLAILNGLAALARQAKIGNRMLMLRVEYRKQR
jgi:hypothetical protein